MLAVETSCDTRSSAISNKHDWTDNGDKCLTDLTLILKIAPTPPRRWGRVDVYMFLQEEEDDSDILVLHELVGHADLLVANNIKVKDGH